MQDKWRNTELNVSLYWQDFFSPTTLKWSPRSPICLSFPAPTSSTDLNSNNDKTYKVTPMIESPRTTQIAFFRFATPSGFSRGAQTRYKKYSCKSPCKRKSYETICENIVSRYQTLVSSLHGEAVFLHTRPKTELTGLAGQPSNEVNFANVF